VSDAGLTLSLPPEALEAIATRAAKLVLERMSGQDQPSPYWTVAEAADYLRCSRQRIYDLLSDGRLTRFKDGSRVLVLREELDRYLEGGCPLVDPGAPTPLPVRARAARG